MTEYSSLEQLLDAELAQGFHVECGYTTSNDILNALQTRWQGRRSAYLLESDRGYGRDTVRAYLKLFSSIAGGAVTADEALAHFGLKDIANTRISALDHERIILVHFARMSLFEPEVCFCERPLADLTPSARRIVLTWVDERMQAGCIFVTTLEPLREALLLPGTALWEEDGRFFVVEQDDDSESNSEEPAFAGDEVQVCKIPAKTDTATLLFDPRDIDYVESMNKANYVSVRSTLYQTTLTMDELEAELVRFGFFRCHRSYIVNVQKVAKVERYTRNSFNLTLNDAAHSSVPLAKGRAEEMREKYGW